MLPATLAILSTTFHGRERATAFAAWGATAGAAAAFGPVVGGFLTTNYSWRWAFGINVIVAPLAIIGALLFMKPDREHGRRAADRLPGRGARSPSGMFLLVFALSEGATYGWLDADQGLHDRWAARSGRRRAPSRSIPLAVRRLRWCCSPASTSLERRKERRQRDPLFEFGQLRHRELPLRAAHHRCARDGPARPPVRPARCSSRTASTCRRRRTACGSLPSGCSSSIGAQLGGRLTRRIGTTLVVRSGLVLEALGLVR